MSHLAVVTLAVSWRGNDVCGVHKKIGGTHEIPLRLDLHQGRRGIHSQLVKLRIRGFLAIIDTGGELSRVMRTL